MPKQNNKTGKLSGLKVLLTRQSGNNEQLAGLIHASQGSAHTLPLIAIESLLTPTLEQTINAKLKKCSLCICISSNAAKIILPKLSASNTCKWAAIGPLTAQYLQEHGVGSVLYPQTRPFDSKALIHTLQNHNLKLQKQYIIILAGFKGDTFLLSSLNQQGAKVELIPIYNRVMPIAAYQQAVNIFKEPLAINIVLITCVTSLDNLMQLAKMMQFAVNEVPLLVVSQRIYAYAKEQGFETVYIAKSMADIDIVTALENYRCMHAKTL